MYPTPIQRLRLTFSTSVRWFGIRRRFAIRAAKLGPETESGLTKGEGALREQ
jgi:hypothetical protein